MDLMKMVTGAVTPMIASKIAGAIGVPEGMVRKVISLGIPVILATLMKRGSTAGGMDAIGSALGAMGKNPLAGLTDALSGDEAQVSAAAQGGSDMLGSLLGVGAAGTLAKTLAGYAGVDEKAVRPLLGLAGSAAMGGLKTTADEQGLDTGGVMRLLAGQKDQITGAIPADFARLLDGAGILPAPAAAPRVAAAAAPPQASGGGMMKWIIGLVAVALLVWLVSQFFGSSPEAVPAASTEAPAAANPLVVEGVNIGEQVQGVFTALTGTLAGVTDVASAQSAVAALTEADGTLAGIEGAVSGLSAEGKTAMQGLIASALPALRSSIDALLADAGMGPILKPVLDSILARLTTYGG